jgi:hypothetical protein
MQCLETEAWSKYTITNEDPADGTLHVLHFWERMMRDKSTAWPWPDQNEQELYLNLFEVEYKSDAKDTDVSNSYARHGKSSRNQSQAAPAGQHTSRRMDAIKIGVVACSATLKTVWTIDDDGRLNVEIKGKDNDALQCLSNNGSLVLVMH